MVTMVAAGRTFDAGRDVAIAEAPARGLLDAAPPDISKFTARGGKLLMYHGWADQMIPPRASVNYYTSSVQNSGAASSSSVRLFMIPGMGHCGGGEGPNVFDTISALEDWVEQGHPPDRLVARRVVDGEVERSRLLCRYPQVAKYVGGSIDTESSFSCAAP